MNGKVMQSSLVDELFIQPASTDAGISQGAAWLAGLDLGIAPIAPNDMSLGNSYTDNQVLEVLQTCKAKFYPCNDPAAVAAELLAEHKVIGWFQGRMEFGPRALGNRSILANPATPNVQQEVNRRIKFRDSFRPFGASVLEQEASNYFEGANAPAPYMTIVYKTHEAYKTQLAGVTHADGTCRIQTVNETQNPLYYRMLSLFKEKTGLGACLNTSFNLNYEPIVCTPQQALATFYASGLDHLVIGKYLVVK
jgi:carbamoyltransferase